MSNSTEPGAAVAYNKFVKKEVVYDLMRGGPGTPWENRGEFGALGGFVRSGVRALFKPNLLFDHIRSTTITAEANTFLWICAACWGVSVAIVKALQYVLLDKTKFNVDAYQYGIVSVIHVAVAVGWAFLMFRLVISLYHKLVITEIKQPVPTTLTFNIAAYAMGPSVFAPIPVVGPLLALVGIFVALVAAGRKRLYITWRGAVIDALIPFAAALLLTVALYFVGGFLLGFAFNPVEPVQHIELPRPPGM
jgi:hypothetical protein